MDPKTQVEKTETPADATATTGSADNPANTAGGTAAPGATDTATADNDSAGDSAGAAGQGSVPADADANAAAALKEALRKERELRRSYEREVKTLKQAAEDATRTPDEQAIAKAQREAASEVTKRFTDMLVRAEIKTAAAGRLADPELAVKLIDITGIEVDENGSVDTESVAAALDKLVAEYPVLAKPRFNGSGEQGARGEKPKAQLTREDLQQMTPEQILKAEKEGLLNNLKGIKKH